MKLSVTKLHVVIFPSEA